VNLEEIRNSYLDEGFSYIDAGSRTCQDVILTLIGRSPLSKNVTIKGGVVMQHLSGSSRRATRPVLTPPTDATIKMQQQTLNQ